MPIEATRARVEQFIADGGQVVEVLPDDEYDWAHLPGAVNIPLKDLENRLDELDVARPVLVYCNDTL